MPIPITLAYSSDGASPDMAASVKESLDFVGFDVQLKGLASAVFSAYLDDPSSPYNLAWFGWEQDYPDAITFFRPLLTCPGGVPAGANYGRFCDQALDARVAATNHLAPGAERNAAFARLSTDTMRTSAPGWPIASERSANLVSSRVGNYLWGPTKLIYLSRVFLRPN